MKKFNILTTSWIRQPERFDYFKKVVEAIKQNLICEEWTYEWIVSSESERQLRKEEMEEFCNKEKIKIFYRSEKPNMANNLNFALSLCNSPLILFLQDDWLLEKKIYADEDCNFLMSRNDVGVLRYNVHHAGYLDCIDKDLDIYYLDPKARYYYSDQPHLKKSIYHQITGPYQNILHSSGQDHGLCEKHMNSQCKNIFDKIKISGRKKDFFGHLGKESTLKEKWALHPVNKQNNKKV